ncbi:uncharacterized protein LOC124462000 [Drosophila willistoni]|uniref:uncharacterized protein LOC124462000 n=1 Tax=Drosophila willistoni TaxID=7260 RepID=UPI001F07521C|nr:uncharacterized protein LOC124462000 [Drosophila willistoni]
MTTVGTLEPFDLGQPNKWGSYLEQFKLFLLANDVKDEGRKKASFLTLVGTPVYDLLTSLAFPNQVSTLPLDQIEKILTDHLCPRPSEIAAFYHFHKRDQHPDETVGNYLAALRALAVGCNFGAALDRMLRDRVCRKFWREQLLVKLQQRVQRLSDSLTRLSTASNHSALNNHIKEKDNNVRVVPVHTAGSNALIVKQYVCGISIMGSDVQIAGILNKFEHLFSTELGCYTGPPVILNIDATVPPVRLPPRRIPYALKGLVEEELDRQCKQGILKPVEYSDWATPIVPVIKKDGSIRICGNYKSTLNKAVKPHS